MPVAEDACRITEGEAEKTEVYSGLKEGGDDELGEPHFGISRNVTAGRGM